MSKTTEDPSSRIDQLANPLDSLIRAALEAGEILLQYFSSEQSLSVHRKDDRSPVTAADLSSQQAILGLLGQRHPGVPTLSEESVGVPYPDRKGWKTSFLVDPLDGTKEFIAGRDEFTVNLSLLEGNRPIIGILHAPARDCLYLAVRDEGAFMVEGASRRLSGSQSFEELIDLATRISVRRSLANSVRRIVVSRSHFRPETKEDIERIRSTGVRVDVIPMGSALKFCRVAEGEADMYIRYVPSMEWDTAAGDLIVHEAGGSMRAIGTNEPLRYNKEDLTNPGFIAEGRRE